MRSQPFKLEFKARAQIADQRAMRASIDESKVFSLGNRFQLDAVLVYTVDVGNTPWGQQSTDNKIEARLFDMKTSEVFMGEGDIDRTPSITKELLSKFKAVRGI